jgi:hypothetical protein
MSEPGIIQVALQCAEAFEQVQAGYFLGGSLASSLQGEPRATNDIDFVVDLQPSQVEALRQALGNDFEVDVEALREAVMHRGSWNIFHLPTVTKVDLFLLRPGAFDRREFSRRRRVALTAEGRGLYIKSPEDSVRRRADPPTGCRDARRNISTGVGPPDWRTGLVRTGQDRGRVRA